ncbi:hypothetical protein [Rhizobium leguminosarum]|uniref:hypothetical protein n=1 Tax=Rhizobium leguminosarum TaxID=384 RepID=UPI0010325D52|nr:hypothetical protein [Rhizobium leguminosarum]TAY98598.1 hypothetical protein ELH79_08995 [Rhizobium leguminosarum]TAZ09363.1 hypothetical protein ELH78_08995 [Rhizobium leguminosarum]
MIFARRAIQRRLDDLRKIIDSEAVDDLVHRLNLLGKDRTAAMWEVIVLHALAMCGSLKHEVPLSDGSRPDIFFDNGSISFTADITSVSDEGLDEESPFSELFRFLMRAQKKLGLPSGGLDVRPYHKVVESSRGTRTVLRLPPRKQLDEFVRSEIIPQLRSQLEDGTSPLRVVVDDERAGLEITIDRAGGEFSTGGFAAYSTPTIKDVNPLYKALKAKASQLRKAGGVTGVIAADGDCAAFAGDRIGRDTVPMEKIAEEFLRQYNSMDFVLLLAVREGTGAQLPPHTVLRLDRKLVMRNGDGRRRELASLFEKAIADFPEPVNSSSNGALRAAEKGFDLGNHGAYKMSSGKIRVSARELMEVLAGIRTFENGGALNADAARKAPRPQSPISREFLAELSAGRLPAKVSVIQTEENENDDWIEFEFGEKDAAITKFR